MRVFECPDTSALSIQHNRRLSDNETLVFLAGGITNCPDWQKEMIARFKDMGDEFMLANPRRASFDITDPTMSKFQIAWEYDHLAAADAIIFWFPYHTLCPITLYELGFHIARSTYTSQDWKKIFVGCHPAYARKFDVEHQLTVAGFDSKVHDNFADLVAEVKLWHNR